MTGNETRPCAPNRDRDRRRRPSDSPPACRNLGSAGEGMRFGEERGRR
jgi:hypothetical protein